MPVARPLARSGMVALALFALAVTGCGLASGLLVGLITDVIEGDGGDGGDPTVLLVTNDAASIDAIVKIDVAKVDGTQPPLSFPVGTAPGTAASLKDVFAPGAHWVRVVYASGWRSRVHTVDVVKDGTVATKFLHGTPDVSVMAGAWFGSGEDSLGVPHTYAFTLDAVGAAGARTIDGVVDAATGTLAETSEGVYRVTWSDTAVYALVADDARGHAGLVVADGSVGALQKGAVAPLPTGVDADVVGTWTGTEVRLTGATLVPTDVDAASATVSASQHWTGTNGDGDGTIGVSPLTVTAPAFLRFEGDAESDATTPVALVLGMWLTADKAFGFVVLAPAAGGTFPDAGVFQLLAKTP